MASTTTDTSAAAHVRILASQNCHVDFTNPCIAKSRVRGCALDVTSELILQETIQVSPRGSSVYRGTMDGSPVVAKIVFGHDIARLNLRKETKNYFAMSNLQGTIIPLVFNYIEGTTPIKGETEPSNIACLILEDCGNEVDSFFRLKLKDKLEILDGLLNMHLCGFHHGDLEERNVVCGRQGYRIIDLEHLLKHRCRWDPENDDWDAGGYYPKKFPCRILKTAGAEMNIWGKDNPGIKILGFALISGAELGLIPNKDIVDCLVPSGIPCTMSNVEFVKSWLKKFKKEMDSTPDCNIEELVAKYQSNMVNIPDVTPGYEIEFKKYNPKTSTNQDSKS